MNKYSYLSLALFLAVQGKIEAAHTYRVDSVPEPAHVLHSADSLQHEKEASENPAATFSAIAAVSSVLISIAGIAGFNLFLFILGGVLGIAAFISGVAGLRKSRKFYREKIARGEKPGKTNPGRAGSILGTVIGSIVSFIFMILLISLAAYSCS